MMEFKVEIWERLTAMYPEIAGIAYEMFLRDPKKEAHPMTYFKFARKRAYEREKRYKEQLNKYKQRKKATME